MLLLMLLSCLIATIFQKLHTFVILRLTRYVGLISCIKHDLSSLTHCSLAANFSFSWFVTIHFFHPFLKWNTSPKNANCHHLHLFSFLGQLLI